MANFATAALVKAQAKLINGFQSGELRYREPLVHKLFLENSSIMLPNYEQLRTREDRTVETNYFLRTSRALGTGGRIHNHTGAQGDSGTFTPSWTTYGDTFVSTLKEADNKIYSWEEQYASKVENAVLNFVEGLESAASDALFAARSGVNISTADGTFDATDDVFEITESTNSLSAFDISVTNMKINKWGSYMYDVVCDSIAYRKFRYQAFQGAGNSDNTSFQFQGYRFVHDPDLTADAAGLVSAYNKGFWMLVPKGTIAALPWIPKQNREGQGDMMSYVGGYGSIVNPIDGLTYALHGYSDRVDGTSLGGYDQDVKIESEISIDLTYDVAPLSTANETPVQAFALV